MASSAAPPSQPQLQPTPQSQSQSHPESHPQAQLQPAPHSLPMPVPIPASGVGDSARNHMMHIKESLDYETEPEMRLLQRLGDRDDSFVHNQQLNSIPGITSASTSIGGILHVHGGSGAGAGTDDDPPHSAASVLAMLERAGSFYNSSANGREHNHDHDHDHHRHHQDVFFASPASLSSHVQQLQVCDDVHRESDSSSNTSNGTTNTAVSADDAAASTAAAAAAACSSPSESPTPLRIIPGKIRTSAKRPTLLSTVVLANASMTAISSSSSSSSSSSHSASSTLLHLDTPNLLTAKNNNNNNNNNKQATRSATFSASNQMPAPIPILDAFPLLDATDTRQTAASHVRTHTTEPGNPDACGAAVVAGAGAAPPEPDFRISDEDRHPGLSMFGEMRDHIAFQPKDLADLHHLHFKSERRHSGVKKTHVRLANTAVGLREIAKKFGKRTLQWESPPKTILIVTKIHDPDLVAFTKDLALWLANDCKMIVLVEERLRQYPEFASFADADEFNLITEYGASPGVVSANAHSGWSPLRPTAGEGASSDSSILFWCQEDFQKPLPINPLSSKIDLIVTLGGDGTVLFTASLFESVKVPPIVPFDLGSLGFLAVFEFEKAKDTLRRILNIPEPVPLVSQTRAMEILHGLREGAGNGGGGEDGGSVGSEGRAAAAVAAAAAAAASSGGMNKFHATAAASISSATSLDTFLPGASSSPPVTLGRSSVSGMNGNGYGNGNGNGNGNHNRGFNVNMRLRLACSIYRYNASSSLSSSSATAAAALSVAGPDVEGDTNGAGPAAVATRSTGEMTVGEFTLAETHHVLNEMVVDRGPSAYMSHLELFVDGSYLTTSMADGLVIGTPTGSTAYSLSAGGSIVHPLVPTLLVTPICPHTLSFRPMLLPESIELRVQVPRDARGTAWVSFDGKMRTELRQGDEVRVEVSRYGVPTVCRQDQSKDWIESLRRCLHWNVRTRQKEFK